MVRIMYTTWRSFMPYLEAGAGGSYNNLDLAGMGSRWNFTLEGGAGSQLEVRVRSKKNAHPPRRCGIATFTTDLLQALSHEAKGAECWAVVMNDVPQGYSYPHEVRFEVNHKSAADFRLAADFLNINRVDIVCLQHQ